jgi:hypothetical protein
LLLKRIQPGDQIRKRISINELAAMTKPYPFNELIICAGTITYKETIQLIKQLPGDLSIKIHAAGSNSIIGSSSKDKPGNAIGLDDL